MTDPFTPLSALSAVQAGHVLDSAVDRIVLAGTSADRLRRGRPAGTVERRVA